MTTILNGAPLPEATICLETAIDRALGLRSLMIWLQDNNFNFYLGGGCVRDALLQEEFINDVDIYLETTDTTQWQQLIHAKKTDWESLSKTLVHKVDVISCYSAVDYSQQADFSINSLLYDPIKQKIIGSDSALADVHQKILRPLHCSYFITSPKAFTRAFRQAAQFNLNLHPQLQDLAKHYGHIQLMATPDQAPKVFAEFIHFLSLPKASALLKEFISWGLLNGILPEGSSHQCINPRTHQTFLEDHLAWINTLDKRVEQLPADEVLALTEWRSKKFSMNPNELDRFSTVKYTQLGLFRLACLLSDLGAGVYSLDDLKENVAPAKIRSASESLINNLALRHQLHHIVYSLILNAGELALQVEDEYSREKESPTLFSRNDLCPKAPSRHKEDAIGLLVLAKRESFG
ncbi:MAG: hypothetical protein QE263_01975 [Vampirovibrionales bacterium]|nr:hypothetical protein [Vampirovibrionales bacterium]